MAMRGGDTIIALSSGALPSGVAVIRLSGPGAGVCIKELTGALPPARQMRLLDIRHDDELIDKGLVVFFPGPKSFTGEDCAELHLHGSAAVVKKLLRVLSEKPGVRLATAGEFTRRAFENGQLDLVEADGLADLINADTEGQRRQALARMDGHLSARIADWRARLLDLRAEIEARLDFSDEGDVDLTLPQSWQSDLGDLRDELTAAIAETEGGRIVREGFRVALAGAPNAGKSSLLNALSKSDMAIVSPEEGTTRDVREVPLDLGGQLVVLLDLAGLRESASLAEAEGVRRAKREISGADLVLHLIAPDVDASLDALETDAPVWRVATKIDLQSGVTEALAVSAVSGEGIAQLLAAMAEKAQAARGGTETALLSRERDRAALMRALEALVEIDRLRETPELAAESLRLASDALARLVGEIDAEQVLDQLFSRFCIGK